MANLTEVSQWESVIRQIENGEAATGGADGLANVQAKQLANRTKWLKGNLAPIVNAAFSGTLKHGNNDLAGSAIVDKSLNYIGYVKYASGLIVQYGHATMVQNTDTVTITYPLSFRNRPVLFAVPSWDRTAGLYPFSCFTTETTGKFQLSQKYSSENNTVNWLAIGC